MKPWLEPVVGIEGQEPTASKGQEGRSYQTTEQLTVQGLRKKLKNCPGRWMMALVLEQVVISGPN